MEDEVWQFAIVAMQKDTAEIKSALKKEITFKNTLIFILLGVAFGVTAITKFTG